MKACTAILSVASVVFCWFGEKICKYSFACPEFYFKGVTVDSADLIGGYFCYPDPLSPGHDKLNEIPICRAWSIGFVTSLMMLMFGWLAIAFLVALINCVMNTRHPVRLRKRHTKGWAFESSRPKQNQLSFT